MDIQPSRQSWNSVSTPETPAFVVDEAGLERQLALFANAMREVWPTGIVAYSVKTNPLPWIVAWMAQHGAWAEVVSDDEYALALALGHRPEAIVFNGPVKSRGMLVRALDGDGIVNLDSRREVRWAAELAGLRPPGSVKVGIRLNWDVYKDCIPGDIDSGAEGMRFGFHVANGDAREVIEQLRAAGVVINGLHLHATSVSRSLRGYESAARVAVETIREYQLDLSFVDVGGGFFGGHHPDFPTPTKYLTCIRDILADVVDPAQTRLVIEPGAALVAEPIDFHTSVIDVKPVHDHLVVVTDGSRTNIDPFLQKTSYVHELVSPSEPTPTPQIVSGFTCLDYDRIMTVRGAPRLAEGDGVIYRRVGSYTMALNPLFINFYPRVYLRRRDGSLELIRQSWTTAEFLAQHQWPDRA